MQLPLAPLEAAHGAHSPLPAHRCPLLYPLTPANGMAGDLTHTERQPDLPCQLLAISVLSSVARALKAGQFLASEAAGLTLRRRLRWKRPLHVHI